jgi:pyruvate/2-oxoglutarate dehydrogenase complex dihydrolipoamide dehydrogenase (E3) component
MTEFDAIIIGAGQAGPPLAGRLTSAGMKVALVERALFGGTCVNTGCMPTKALVASAYVAHLARRSGDFGVVVDEVRVDIARVKARADALVVRARKNIEKWLGGMSACTVLRGHARFEEPRVVRVGDERLRAPRVFINVGGRAIVPDMPGVRDVPVLTNSSILALDKLPEHLVIVGGSYVGLEFAQIYRRFGAAVTVVERAEGIVVRTNADCIRLAPHERGVAVSVNCSEGEPHNVGSHVLLAVGRRPNTEDLGLDRAGVKTDPRGYVIVDDSLSTNVDGIWALGECNGRGAFTHTAYNDHEIVAANLLDGAERKLSARIPGYALYIDPPLGRAGMTEREARASGRSILVGKRLMARVGRAIEKGETQGLMKIVVDAETRMLLGAAILGTGGDEAIHGVLDMMNARVTDDVLKWAVPIHPTTSELIPTLLSELRPPSD